MVNAVEPQNEVINASKYPKKVFHWINDETVPAASGEWFEKRNPHNGKVLSRVARGTKADADRAIEIAVRQFPTWSQTPVITRADILRRAVQLIELHKKELAELVALETGKSPGASLGEVGAAIENGYFWAGEGRRFYGKTTTSAVPNRQAMTVRQPVGVAALIIAANTPLPNLAWKTFPALLCGNTAILKTSEDIPYSAVRFAEILKEAGLPAGVFQVLQGYGPEVGAPLVEDERVDLVSFTGSVPVGRWIQKVAGERLAKVSLELGGKNALVVCDDAALEFAADAAVQAAFSNAGQRCASGSRIVVFDAVYDEFRRLLLAKTEKLKLGNTDQDDFGPVINERQLANMLAAIQCTMEQDSTIILTGGQRVESAAHQGGYYMAPTIVENVSPQAEFSHCELFGPITALYRVKGFEEAVEVVNNSPMGLTAAIHTQNVHRALRFQELVRTGVVSINGPTHGSEPHMPFGGLKASGNGFREPGTEALDFYAEWKTVYMRYLPEHL